MAQYTKELHNALIDKFEERSKECGYKGKTKVKQQLEFLIGAVSAIDFLIGDPTATCLPPIIWVGAIRGDLIKKFDMTPQQIEQ